MFVDVPLEIADLVADLFPRRAGFGSVPVRVAINGFAWQTSIFPDKASGSFVLPVKKLARQRAGIDIGDRANVELALRLP